MQATKQTRPTLRNQLADAEAAACAAQTPEEFRAAQLQVEALYVELLEVSHAALVKMGLAISR